MGTVSKLATKSILCRWEYNARTQKVIGIIPHYMAAHWTAEQCANYFVTNGIENSSNYCIGYDGSCVCNVEEQNRAWTSSSSWADQRCITVEIGGSAGDVALIPDAALEKFKQLATDIALRYGIKKYVYTGGTDGNLMLHEMFAATPCPGWHLKKLIKEGNLIKDINDRIAAGDIYGAKTGWKKEDGKWYYYEKGKKKTGWLKDKGEWYYLDSTGVMQTGWLKQKKKTFYLEDNGRMVTGWQKIGGKWYRFADGDSGYMLTGWIREGGKSYYAGPDGALLKGWQTISGKKYYFKGTYQVMVTGWFKGSKKWYYFTTKGVYHDKITKKYQPEEVTVTADILNIRKGASSKSSLVGELKKGTQVYITKKKKSDGFTWGLLNEYFPNKDGWIALEYTKK